MLIEDDGWEEIEVKLEGDVNPVEDNNDDPISDIDSDHSDEQSSCSDQLVTLDVIFCDLKQWTCNLGLNLVIMTFNVTLKPNMADQ